MKIIYIVILALVCLRADAAKQRPAGPTGIYSDLKYNAEGGDLLGAEIFLFRADNGYYVLFQSAQGEPSAPALVRADLVDSHITFELPHSDRGYSGSFVGVIYPDRLEGKFMEGQKSPTGKSNFVLKKGRSYWQR